MKKLILSMFAAGFAAAACVAQSVVPLTPAPRLTDQFTVAAPVEKSAMKKAPAMAEEQTTNSLDFTLAFQPYSATQLNNSRAGMQVYFAFEVTAENCKKYAGMTIESINIYAGCEYYTKKNDMNNITVFITSDLSGEFEYTQAATLTDEAFGFNKIALDTPYKIEENKPFYVGYYLKTVKATDLYLVYDGVPTNDMAGGYFGTVSNSKVQWQNVADQLGNICMGATIVGEGLPQNGCSVYSVDVPPYVAPGEPFTVEIGFVGAAANKAENVVVEYTIGSAAPQTFDMNFVDGNTAYYLGYNELAIWTIPGFECNESGTSIPFTVKITKVNGKDNVSTDNTATADFQCFDRSLGFTRTHVVEEGTGTWCGYCPQGIVMMEYLEKNFPTEFIRIGLHYNDEMAASTCQSIISSLNPGGFPFGFVNRTYDTMLGYSGVDVNQGLADYYEENKSIPSVVGIEGLEVNFKDERSIEIPTTVKFAFDVTNNNRYRLAYYLTEDNVGPYSQHNYYSGQSDAPGGWGAKGEYASIMFNDVARRAVGSFSGTSNSLPKEITAQEACEYTATASLTGVTGDSFYVTAMVIDSTTGVILNAKQVKVDKPAGVSDVENVGGLKVSGVEGGIAFGGDYTEARIYNVAGQLVATATGEGFVAVPAGLYIVKADGTTAKVAAL